MGLTRLSSSVIVGEALPLHYLKEVPLQGSYMGVCSLKLDWIGILLEIVLYYVNLI